MYRLELTLLGLPRMTNPSGRKSHWAILKKEKDKWKSAVALATLGKRPLVPLKRARLTLTRCSSVSPDADGLVSGFKHIIDALVLCGVLENDRVSNIGMPTYKWLKAPRGQGQVWVEVEEI